MNPRDADSVLVAITAIILIVIALVLFGFIVSVIAFPLFFG